MKYLLYPPTLTRLAKFPREIQNKFWKQIQFLLQNIQHPSLRAKKYDEPGDVWQARIDRHYRFFFKIKGDTYLILDINAHKD